MRILTSSKTSKRSPSHIWSGDFPATIKERLHIHNCYALPFQFRVVNSNPLVPASIATTRNPSPSRFLRGCHGWNGVTFLEDFLEYFLRTSAEEGRGDDATTIIPTALNMYR